MSAVTYARYDHDAYTAPEPDYSGLECTVDVEQAPLRLYGGHGPVVAYLAGRVEIIGKECASFSVGDVTLFDADDNRHFLTDMGTGSLEAAIRDALIGAAEEEALETLYGMARGH